jgi:hypothetical protein
MLQNAKGDMMVKGARYSNNTSKKEQHSLTQQTNNSQEKQGQEARERNTKQ